MLATLRIKNLALVADLTLELQPGLNVISGETGAGKTILIGAMNLVLGERADRTLIRSGEEHCTVEAIFDARKLRAPLPGFLLENGLEPCEDGQLVLKRTFSTAGTNRQFINGSPTTLQTLARAGEWLVDIHGPHDHQSLLHGARQLAILDAFGGLQAVRESFGELVRRRAAVEAEKAALVVDERTYEQQLDLLRFQVREITGARLRPDEDAQVEDDHRRASNAARLIELARAALSLLSDDDNAVQTQLGTVGRLLQAFGVEVSVARQSGSPAGDDVRTVPYARLSELLPRADWLVVCCPLGDQTRQLIDDAVLSRLPPVAHLVNVARGEIVDEDALIAALKGGALAGAYLDVFAFEPLVAASPLWDLPNVIVTPHSAGLSDGNEVRVARLFLEKLAARAPVARS